jgi:hypothetical protein
MGHGGEFGASRADVETPSEEKGCLKIGINLAIKADLIFGPQYGRDGTGRTKQRIDPR